MDDIPQRVKVPYLKIWHHIKQYLSNVRHEKSGMNPPRPLGKAKYFFTPIVQSTVRER